jgi:hypothetical protein
VGADHQCTRLKLPNYFFGSTQPVSGFEPQLNQEGMKKLLELIA